MSIGNIDKDKLLSLYSPSGVLMLKKMYAETHIVSDPDPCCDDKFAGVT